MSDHSETEHRRIKILHSVGHLHRGGIETWLYQMINRLDRSRFQHSVLVRTAKEEAYTQLFRDAGVQVIPCLNFKNPLQYARNLRRIVKEHGPYDILHVHGSNFNGVLTLLLSRPLGIKASIAHSHNDVRPLLAKRGAAYGKYSAAVRQLLRRLPDLGLAASVLAAESMFGTNWHNNSRYRLMYCGIDFKPFGEAAVENLRVNLGIDPGAFVVGHVGRFHEQKNHVFLIDVAEQVIAKANDAHFLLIGDGALREGIQRSIEARGLTQHFTFVPDTLSVPSFMTGVMDAFIFPSKYEGLGLVAVEAQAAGLPSVISDRVPREAIVNESLVTVLPLQDPASWADALLAARNMTRSYCDLPALSKSRFNIDNCVQSLSKVYTELRDGCFQGEIDV